MTAVGNDQDGVVRLYTSDSCTKPFVEFETHSSETRSIHSTDNFVFALSDSSIFKFDTRNPKTWICKSKDILNPAGLEPYGSDHLVVTLNKRDTGRVYFTNCEGLLFGHYIPGHTFATQIKDQLIVGAEGGASVYYDAANHRSYLQGTQQKQATRKQQHVFVSPASVSSATIIAPNLHPMFAASEHDLETLADPLNLKRLKDRLARSNRPDVPLKGEGHDGRIGTGPNAIYMRQIIEKGGVGNSNLKSRQWDEDPREALLKYADIAEQEPMFVTPAYNAAYNGKSDRDDEDEEHDELVKKKKRTVRE